MKLDVIQDQRVWYADGLRFECCQCGNCCTGGPGYVWISDVEIDRLAAHLHITRNETIELYCRKIDGRWSLREHRNSRDEYDCIFLREIAVGCASAHHDAAGCASAHHDGVAHPPAHTAPSRRVCIAYEVRPLQCRTWPFWEGNLMNEENWRRAGIRCPGINRGKLHDRAHIEKMRDADDWP